MNSPRADAHVLIAANPFPGLRSFRPGEADRFFGRQQQIDELVARLGEVPFIAVSGASGCGKSSLVLAGLLHELKRRHDEDFETDWRPVVLRPGNRPIANLAAPLAAALESAPAPVDGEPGSRLADTLYGQLRLGGLGLVEAVRNSRLPATARVLVVVDQFEEIFRFKRMADPDEAAAFVKLLLQAAADPGSRIRVVITLRSDTLGACADFRDLPEAASRGGYLVPRLKREQRKQAIVKPVELRGARIAPRLVQRLLNDVSDDFDDLPVMQHALSRTWQRWAEACAGSRPIDLEDYAATGGAASALNDHADEAWRSLGPLGEPGGTVERVFRALTERVAEGTEVRRPLEFSQLCAICGGGTPEGITAVTQVVERYRRADTAFLVPGSERALADNPVIDISHESLMRQWARLRGWVQAEVDASTELHALVREAQAQAQGQGELRHGLDLGRARAWQLHNRPNPAWVQLCLGGTADEGATRLQQLQQFLDQGAAAEAQAKRRNRLRRLGMRSLAATVVLVSVVAAVVGITLQSQARSRELVSRAVLAQAQDPVRSARLALGALQLDGRNQRADYALRQAMSALEVARTAQQLALDEPLSEARYSDDGQRLLVAGGRSVWLLDAASLQTLHKLATPAAVLKAWVLGEQVISFTDDYQVRLQTLDGKTRADLACPGSGPDTVAASVAYSPARAGMPAQLAVGCYNGALLLWDLGPEGVLAQQVLLPGDERAPTLNALGFSGDGLYLASGHANGELLVWKRGQGSTAWVGTPLNSPMRHQMAVRDIAFHPGDDRLLASASDDGSARVWTLDLDKRRLATLEAGHHNPEQLQHDRQVLGVRFVQRADDKYLLMTRSDKRVFFWSDGKTFDERAHADTVTDANASKDGELLVSASADGTAQLWSSRAATAIALLRGHRNEVTRAVFSPQADAVITVSRDRTLRRWQLNRPVMLAAGRQWQLAAALDPAAPRAVLCGETGQSPPGHCRISPLADLATRASTSSEWLAFVDADAVVRASFSADGKLVLGVATSQDIYQTTKPVLWDAGSRQRLNPAWLDTWAWASFAPGRAELVTLRPPDAPGAPEELVVWPQQALAGDEPGAPLLKLVVPQGHLSAAALSADGRWLAAVRADHVLLWDRQAPAAAPRELRGHRGDLRSLVFSADSRFLATASSDRTARVWPVAAGEPVLLQGGHAAALTAVAFSPDGRQVLTGSTDSSLRLWDASSGRERVTLQRHADAVTAVLFSNDGQRLLSASADGTVRFEPCQACSLPADQLQAQARAAVQLVGPPDAEDAAALAQGLLPRWLGGGR